MKVFYRTSILSVLFLSLISQQIQAQYATKKVRSVHQAYTDSLKSVKYNYQF